MCEWLLKWTEPAVLIQCLILLGLIWYACETWKLRRASQEQIEVMEKPCVVPSVVVRPEWGGGEVSHETTFHGVMVFGRGVSILNIGKATAFDIEYEIQKHEEPKVSRKGYLPILPDGQDAIIGIPIEELNPSKQHKQTSLKLSYVSQSGKRYTSLTKFRSGNQLIVVTDISFD